MTYAEFCKAYGYRQTAKGLRFAFRNWLDSGNATWLLIAGDCSQADTRKRAGLSL